ncbi:plasmid partitioning protein [uncultured Rothia sp.]|uniref:plasmid partitioning protein n=1 Tax=uncultured Rothia sp. TaxID=316088 RepID=UPI0028D5AB4D|nr:plasmid partitioning protein [uncultured Rothia sp.]
MRAPFSAASSKAPLTRKALTACAAASLALGLGMGTASALPPGGAKASTPGTSSTVSSSVTEHGVISFTLSGFPANTQVSVKVDDGDLCPSDAPQGSCVVHQQMSDGNGNVSGSFVLPDVGTGTHTLRFLAAGEEKFDDNGISKGRPSYTNRSPEFTVTSEGGSDSSNSSKSSSRRTGSEDSSSSQGDESNGEVETVYTDAEGNVISKEEYDRLNAEAGSSESASASAEPKETVKATASASASSSAPARGSASVPSASASASASSSSVNNAEKTVQTVTYGAAFPWVGVIVLGLSLVAAAAVLVIRKR